MIKLLICLPWALPLALYEGDSYGTAFMLFIGAGIGAAITAEILGVSFED